MFRKKLSGAKTHDSATAPSYETVRKLCCETSENGIIRLVDTTVLFPVLLPNGALRKSASHSLPVRPPPGFQRTAPDPSASLVHADGMVIVRKKSTDSCFPALGIIINTLLLSARRPRFPQGPLPPDGNPAFLPHQTQALPGHSMVQHNW